MEQIRKNDIFEADIVGYTHDGAGVARIGGRAVFIPRTIEGERWRIVIVKVTGSAAYGRALEPLRLSPERTEPDCDAFPRCGGCTLRHMSYSEELRFKKQKVGDALEHIAGFSDVLDGITGSAATESYRNKAIYAVREVDGKARKGFFSPRSHALVPVRRCHIQSEKADSVADAVADFMNERGIRAYDEASRRGLVRHVFVRRAVYGNDVLAVIVANGGFGDQTAAFTEYLRARCPYLTGIVLNVNKSAGNTVLAGKFYTLWGRDYIVDSLDGVSFHLSAQSFYQVNPPQAEKLYRKALEFAQPEGKTVLDMYCGVGTISLLAARTAERVIGAEIVPEAIQNARENAELNGIKNAEFLCADASEAAEKLLRDGVRPDTVIVDPPRRGMDERAVRALCSMAPERIVYVSCDPATLARDAKLFAALGYPIRRAEAFDMFPRTSHVETVVLLSHKKPDGHINVKVEFGEGEGKVPLDNIAKRAEEYKPKERVTYKMIKEYIEAKYGFKVHTAYIAEVKRDLGLPMYDAPNAVEELKQPRKHPTAEKVEAIKDALKHFEVI